MLVQYVNVNRSTEGSVKVTPTDKCGGGEDTHYYPVTL